MIPKANANSKRLEIIYPLALAILLVMYYLLYLNRCYPVNEGWHIAYAELVMKGKIPYRDFYYYMPPLDIFWNCILWKLSGGYFLVFRIFRMLERISIFLLLYHQLKKLVKPLYAWFSCLIGGVFISANVYDLLGDYNQTVELLCVLLACTMIRFVHAETEKKKAVWMIISGSILGLAFLHKQTLIVASGVTLFLFLIFYCYIQKESFIKRFVQAFAGLLIPTSICACYLFKNHAWEQFLEQVFFSADSKGGTLFDIIIAPLIEITKQHHLLIVACGIILYYFLTLGQNKSDKKLNIFRIFTLLIVFLEIFSLTQTNLTNTLKLLFSCSYIVILIGIWLLLMFLEQRGGVRHSNIYLAIICITFVLLEFFMYRSYNGFSYRWYTETSAFQDIEKILNTLFILLVFSVFFLIVQNIRKKNIQMDFLVLFVCSFISSYAGLMTSKTLIPSFAGIISTSIFIAIALEKTVKHNKIKNTLLIECCLVLCMLCMSQKITCAYSWWGTTENELYEETYPIDVKGLEGFRVSEEQSRIFEEVVKTINDNTDTNSTLMAFPGMTIFNLLTDHDYAGFTPVYFYDVCADKYAEMDAEIYKSAPPDIVIWWDIPGCIETHEALFRNGQTSGQRKIIEWFAEESDEYTLICQVSNIFFYKLNNELPIGYTYFENKNLLPTTIYPANTQPKKDYQDYSLKGTGTSDDPFLIQSKNDLIEFREMVNSGLDFSDKYVIQTNDIDLSPISNWIPIGIMESGKYFCGTYDGRGHTINNLTISPNFEKERETMYSGFFGQLGGTVKNLGFENGYIYGDYIGGIASHPYQNPQIVNCYFKGTLVSNDRAGGIADNFSGGKIVNCYFEGTINAPTAYGIASYQASAVIDSISIGFTNFNSALVARNRNNMVLPDTSDDISDFFNQNIKLFSSLGLYDLKDESYSIWQSDGKNVVFSNKIQISHTKYYFLIKFTAVVIVLLVILKKLLPKGKIS